MERMQVRERRRMLRVSLDAVAFALGRRFSRARLSAWERGVAHLSPAEVAMMSAAVERIGQHQMVVHEIIMSNQIDLSELCSDIRECRF